MTTFTYTHTPFNSHFPDQPRLDGCRFDFQSPDILPNPDDMMMMM